MSLVNQIKFLKDENKSKKYNNSNFIIQGYFPEQPQQQQFIFSKKVSQEKAKRFSNFKQLLSFRVRLSIRHQPFLRYTQKRKRALEKITRKQGDHYAKATITPLGQRRPLHHYAKARRLPKMIKNLMYQIKIYY